LCAVGLTECKDCSFVCSNHFAVSDFIPDNNFRQCLKRTAIPSFGCTQNSGPATEETATYCNKSCQTDQPPEMLAMASRIYELEQEIVHLKCILMQTQPENKAATQSAGNQTSAGTKNVAVSCNLICEPIPSHSAFSPMLSQTSTLSVTQKSDLSYQPSSTTSSQSDSSKTESGMPGHCSAKYIVYKSSLSDIFCQCSICHHSCSVNWHEIGTFVSVTQTCSNCDYTRKWNSQPMINNIPAGNLHLSAALYFSGASFSKFHQVAASLRLASISSSTFYGHVRTFLQPTILEQWNDSQKEMLQWLCQVPGDIILGGDMRADSPGHCAKYGSYTVMELRHNRVIDIQLVQSNEVHGSTNMEKAGLVKSLHFLENEH